MKHYILVNKIPKEVSLMEWAEWIGNSNRIVKQTHLTDNIMVSTVFLGIDHSFDDGDPILFETMIFGGKHNEYQERYTTWDDAIKGHSRACQMILSKVFSKN